MQTAYVGGLVTILVLLEQMINNFVIAMIAFLFIEPICEPTNRTKYIKAD